MTGGGAPGASGILECLNQEKSFNVIVADAKRNVIGRIVSKNAFEQIPAGDDPSFVKNVLEVCKKHGIDLILPLVTKELIPLAKHKDNFNDEGVSIPISSAASLEIANNKSRLYEFLQWRDIPVPEFRVIENTDQFKDAVQQLGYPGKTVCFKPSVSNGSRGFRIIDHNVNELDLLLNYKPDSSYITMSDAIRILESGSFPELLISEFLPGDEYSVDCLANHGDTVIIIPRLRKRMIKGISVEGEFIKNDEIIFYCSRIIKELRLHGNIGIQVKKSGSGKFLILEINPRVQGSIAACLGAGVNLPVLSILQESGITIAEDLLKVKWGVKFIKHWSTTFY